MMKKRLLILTLILAFLGTPIIALASNISGAKYWAVIQISNNSTATTDVATTANISTQNLIDGNYLNSEANNCVMRTSSGADVPFMPSINSSYPWCLWVPSIGTNSYQSDILYTANSTGGLLYYFPGAGGMTTPDNDATLEPGGNFTIEQKGGVKTIFTDNYSDRNLVCKEGAFRTFVSGSENITSQIGIEDFRTYTEVDAGNKLAVTTLRATGADVDSDENVYLYKDKGVDFFDALDIDFELYIASTSLDNAAGGIAISNTVGTIADFVATDMSVIAYRVAGPTYRIIFRRGAALVDDFYVCAADTPYYCTLERAAASDVGWVRIYTDSARTVLVDSLNVAGFGAATKYRYVYGFVNHNVPAGGRDWDGYIQEIHVPGSGIEVTATGISSDNHTVRTTTDTSAVHSDGSTNSINCGAGASLDITDNLTMEAWVNLDAAGLAGQNPVFTKTDRANCYALVLAAGEVIVYLEGTNIGGNAYWFTGQFIAADSWYHIVVTYDKDAGANNLKVYVNGAVTTTTGTLAITSRIANILNIGHDTQVGDKWMDGLIDEARIYNRTISQAEVTHSYNSGRGRACPSDTAGLVGWWTLDEGEGTTAFDSTANSNDGTITGGVTWEDGIVASQLAIFIDNIKKDGTALTCITVPDTSGNWTFVQNGTMPYLEYQKLWIGGTLHQHIVWEYDNIFTDLSTNGNDATPTFRAASSDPDVSAEMISFQPVAEAKAPSYALGEAPAFIDSAALTGNVTGAFTTTPGAGTFPLAEVIIAIANATGTPAQLPLLIIALFVILAVSLAVSATMRTYGSGSLLIKMLVIAAVMGVFVGLGNFSIDFWMILVFLIIAVAIGFMSKQVGFS